MSSRTDRAAFAKAAVIALLLVGCSASGDQVLGTIRRDNETIRTDASPPVVPDAGGRCNGMSVSDAREIASDLDIYFVIDRSAWMFGPMGDKWDAFVSGFTHFLQEPAVNGVGIGVGYFPAAWNPECAHCPPRDCACLAACGCSCDMRMDPRLCPQRPICDPNSYDRADVDIGRVPQNNSTLVLSLAPFPIGPTVIRPALEGGLEFATEHAERNGNDRVALILVAGGPPAPECGPSSVLDCANVAARSNTKTYVVAFDYVGPSLEPIATRGGGKVVESRRDDVAGRLAQLVTDIKNEPHCHYEIPQDTDPSDLDKISLEIAFPNDAGASTRIIADQVKNRSACNGGLGWYYDRMDHPTRIIACDATCGQIHGSREGKVVITVGCVAPPP